MLIFFRTMNCHRGEGTFQGCKSEKPHCTNRTLTIYELQLACLKLVKSCLSRDLDKQTDSIFKFFTNDIQTYPTTSLPKRKTSARKPQRHPNLQHPFSSWVYQKRFRMKACVCLATEAHCFVPRASWPQTLLRKHRISSA